MQTLHHSNQLSPGGSTQEISHIVSSLVPFLPIRSAGRVCVVHVDYIKPGLLLLPFLRGHVNLLSSWEPRLLQAPRIPKPRVLSCCYFFNISFSWGFFWAGSTESRPRFWLELCLAQHPRAREGDSVEREKLHEWEFCSYIFFVV